MNEIVRINTVELEGSEVSKKSWSHDSFVSFTLEKDTDVAPRRANINSELSMNFYGAGP
jgi:hypothetical protein